MANNPFYVQPPDILPGISMLSQAMLKRSDIAREKARGQKNMEMRGQLSALMQTGSADDIAQFVAANPGASDIFAQARGAGMQSRLDSAKRIVMEGQDPAKVLTADAEAAIKRGEDAKPIMNEIATAHRNPEMSKAEAEKFIALNDPQAYKQYKEMASGIISEPKVGAQEILEDGSIIQSTSKGPVVYNPEGERVKGRKAAETVQRARAEKVSNARKMAGEKKRAALEADEELKAKVEAGVLNAKEAAKISVKAFDNLQGINQNIANIDEAIRLVDEGAETGFIASKLPSIRKASIELDNLQGRLGLDVIRNTTFGALSESELKFALDTALPQSLQGQDLKECLQRKKDAQEKLADYIEASAIFLGQKGNTVADWMQKQREKRLSGEQQVPTNPTQEQYNALPSGTVYIYGGKKYRKK
jgi:hypothetical protein